MVLTLEEEERQLLAALGTKEPNIPTLPAGVIDPRQIEEERQLTQALGERQPQRHVAFRMSPTEQAVAKGLLPAVQGMTFGFGEEAAAGLGALGDVLRGRGGLGESYQARVQALRGIEEKAQKEHPYLSGASEILGGLASGGAIAKGLAKAPLIGGAIGRMGQSVLGRGALGVGAGATEEAVRGVGEAETLEEAPRKALAGALMGGVGGGVGAGLGELGAQALRRISRPGLGGAEKVIESQLGEVGEETLGAGIQKLQQAQEAGAPKFAFTEVERLVPTARGAAITPQGRDVALQAIKGETEGQLGRVGKTLESIAPETTGYRAGQNLQDSAKNVMEDMFRERTNRVQPFYELAEQAGELSSDKLDDLLEKSSNIQKGIKEAKTYARFTDLADNDTRVLQEAKKFMDDEIEKAVRGGERGKAKLLTEERNVLNDEIKKLNPALQEADQLYAEITKNIEKVEGFPQAELKKIIKAKDVSKASSEIFKNPPEQIAKLKSAFEKAEGADAWNSAVREHVDRIFRENKGSSDPFRKIMESTEDLNKLKSALGKDEYNKLITGLQDEQQRFLSRRAVTPGYGSPTAEKLLEQQALGGQRGLVRSLLGKGGDYAMQAIGALTGGRGADYNRQLAEILFSPEKSQEVLQKILARRAPTSIAPTVGGGFVGGQLTGQQLRSEQRDLQRRRR